MNKAPLPDLSTNYGQRIGAIGSAIGFLSLFQDKLNLGDMLRGLLVVYTSIRNVFFFPLDFINVSLPEKTENILFFLFLTGTAFLLRGGKTNKIAAICLLGGLGWAVVFFVGLFALAFLGMGAVFGEVDTLGYGNASIIAKLTYPLFLAVGTVVMFCLMQIEGWAILILFPFIGALFARIPKVNLIVPFFLWQSKISIKAIDSIFNKNFYASHPDARVFFELWSLDEYIVYYKPILQIFFYAGIILLVFKVFLDSIF